MDRTAFERRVKRLKEINEVVEKLDPAIRQDAFALLAEYVSGETGAISKQDSGGKGLGGKGTADSSTEELVVKHASDTPAENAKLIAACFYNLYGKTPFTQGQMHEAADEFGVVIPDRPDQTLRGATKDGKKLFNVKSGNITPTVHGERFLRETYGVTKGSNKRLSEDG